MTCLYCDCILDRFSKHVVGNKVPENMIAVEERLELLSNITIRDVES